MIEKRKGEKNHIENSIKNWKDKKIAFSKELRNVKVAQTIAQVVAKETQATIEYHISELVSLALASIFEVNPYKFSIEFLIKRGKTEAKPYFLRDGEKLSPMLETGGGAVDIAAFALMVALWKLSGKERNCIILDEPFRFVSEKLQPKAGKFLKLLSDELNLQFIIVTHNQFIVNEADKIFQVSLKKGISKVEAVNG